jgi:hypothetical protein
VFLSVIFFLLRFPLRFPFLLLLGQIGFRFGLFCCITVRLRRFGDYIGLGLGSGRGQCIGSIIAEKLFAADKQLARVLGLRRAQDEGIPKSPIGASGTSESGWTRAASGAFARASMASASGASSLSFWDFNDGRPGRPIIPLCQSVSVIRSNRPLHIRCMTKQLGDHTLPS